MTSAELTQFLLSGLTSGAIYALIALGFCIIHNATGIVNFTQVDFVTLGGFMMYTSFIFVGSALIGWNLPGVPFKIEPLPPVPWWLKIVAFILAVASVTVIGAVVERVFIRPSRSKEVIILIFITIGASILLRGIFEVVWGKTPVAVPEFTEGTPWRILGASYTRQDLWILCVTLVSIGCLHYFFQRTLTGKAMRAAAVNTRAASLAGISVNRMIMLSFALAGTLGALAGVLITPIVTLFYSVGVMIGLKGFAAAILGGYGNFIGAIVGGLLLGVMESMGAGIISSAYKDVIAFVILVLVLFIRPAGILGRGEAKRV